MDGSLGLAIARAMNGNGVTQWGSDGVQDDDVETTGQTMIQTAVPAVAGPSTWFPVSQQTTGS